MVFETVVTDVLNRYLGAYVENLDASQLRIGIFGGDVNLKDLIIRPSALNDFNLPFRVSYGFIKKLTLKIPWKEPYSAPVVCTIDGIYAVVVPSSRTSYDEEKEFRSAQDAKQRILLKNEEMKAKARELMQSTPKKEDTLIEKIVAQVIKNVQAKITNIHIRYEDNFTNPAMPFSCGVTLNKLDFETVDANWKPQMADSTQHVFRKLVLLDSVAFYWNSKVRLISHLSPGEILRELMDTIARENYKPPGIGYMIGPITSSARMTVNQKPEISQYQMPSVTVDLTIEDISIGFSKCQYHDIMALIDSLNRMWLADKYRKHRPSVPVHRNSKLWWKFAYNSTLEHQVRPHRRQWNKDFLLDKIRKIKEYRNQYKAKLLQTKYQADRIKLLEEELDTFNIILARRQAEVEVENLPKPEPKKGWFTGWWGSAEEKKGGNEIVSSIQKEMTPEEKAKLYAAIDYNENQVPLEFPIYFVDQKLNFLLKKLCISITDDSTNNKEIVMRGMLNEVSASLEKRPRGDALKIEVKMESFNIESFPNSADKRRSLVSSDQTKQQNCTVRRDLLHIMFETNPLDCGCDQRIRVNAEPLEMFYDVRSFNALFEVFKQPENVSIENIQNTAVSSFRSLRVLSASGLEHAIDNKPSIDLLVQVKPSYILAYEGGKIDDTKNVLVLSLGQLTVKSKPRKKDAPSVRQLVESGKSDREVMKALFSEAYDKTEIHISAAEILVVPASELWRDCVRETSEAVHILQPLDLYLDVDFCFLPDEKRIPKVKVSAKLPALEIDLSDKKLINTLKIVTSLVATAAGDGPRVKPKDVSQLASIEEAGTAYAQETNIREAQTVVVLPKERDTAEAAELEAVVVDLSFEITTIVVRLQIVQEEAGVETYKPMLVFATNESRLSFKQHKLDYHVDVTLKQTYLRHCEYKLPQSQEDLKILETTVDPGTGFMLQITYDVAEPIHPEFQTRFNNTLASAKCIFGEVTFALHQEAIVSLIDFRNVLMAQLQTYLFSAEVDSLESTSAPKMDRLNAPTSVLGSTPVSTMSIPKKGPKKPPVTQFGVAVTVNAVNVIVCRTNGYLARLYLTGMEGEYKTTRRQQTSRLVLKSINMVDPNEGRKHPQIISMTGEDVLNVKLIQYEESGEAGFREMDRVDMAIEVTIGRMYFVFLWKFYLDVMAFLDCFQAAKDRVADVTAAAAAAAKGAAEMAYAKAYKLSLDMTVKAPVIFVPQSSLSQKCLVMDFGVFSIKNSFSPGSSSSASKDIHPLFENTKISIDDLKMYRCVLKPLTNMVVDGSEFSLMDPLSFGLDVQRNLAAAAHKSIPELKMKGTIESVCFKLGEDDYAAVMKTIGENFTEVPDRYVKPVEQQVTTSSMKTSSTDSGEQVVTIQSHDITSAAEQALVRVEAFFSVKEVKVTLYSRRTAQTSHELCELNITDFKTCGNFHHDNSFWANLCLDNLILDDKRPSRKGGVRRLISKLDEGEKMIELMFQKQSTGASATTIRVSKMRFIYSAPLNMALLNIIHDASEDTEALSEKDKAVERERQKRAIAEKSSYAAAAAPRAPAKIVPYTVIIEIREPDFILVADLDNPTSNCIIFKSSIGIRVKQDEEKMRAQIKLDDIEMFVSSMDSQGVRSEILKKCCINLDMDRGQQGDNVKVDVSSIEIHLTPSAVEIVSVSLSALYGANDKRVTDEMTPQFFDPKKIWMPQRIEEIMPWYHARDEVEVAQEAVEESAEEVQPDKQIASFSMDSVLITIEQGAGNRTMPMLLLSMSLKGDAFNWSSQLESTALINMLIFYYNERYAVWEPLLETVETNSGARKPWETIVEMRTAPLIKEQGVPECQLPPLMSLKFICKDPLELTVTKTALQVAFSLQQEFSQAFYRTEDMVDANKIVAPYCVQNSLGIPFTINVNKSNFFIVTTEDDQIRVDDGKKIELDFRDRAELTSLAVENTVESVAQPSDQKLFFNVGVNFGNTSSDRKIDVNHTARRVYRVPFRSYPGDDWSYVVDVSSHFGSRMVNLYSLVEVQNAFSVPMDVYFRERGELIHCATVQSKQAVHLPLKALYTYSSELLFKPHGDRYQVAEASYDWKNKTGEETMVSCLATNPSKPAFYMNVLSTTEEIPFDDNPLQTCTVRKLSLAPRFLVNNLLPMMIDVNLRESNVHFELEAGASIELWNLGSASSILNIRLTYLDKNWHCAKHLDNSIEGLTSLTFTSTSDENNLDLAMHCEKKEGSRFMSIHSPFWMVNRTDADLYYRAIDDSLCHPKGKEDPLLFTFGAKNMFSANNKFCVKMFDSDWSPRTSLDAVGQSGTIMMKNPMNERIYLLSVHVALSSTTLTRIVTFTPFYLVMNNSKFGAIEVRESSADGDFMVVPKGQCLPLWPNGVKKVELQARFAGTTEQTVPFSIKESVTVLLRLDNKYGGILMTCQAQESSIIISLSDFEDGISAVQIVNGSDYHVNFKQEFDGSSAQGIQRGYSMHYSWEDPRENRRLVCWVQNHDFCKVGPLTDSTGSIKLPDGGAIYWISFLDGKQRVLYFLNDENRSKKIMALGSLERVMSDYELEFNGMGISLVDDGPIRREIAYLSITGSGAHWEARKKSKTKFKSLNQDLAEQAEIEYQKYLKVVKTVGPDSVSASRVGKYRFDFNQMKLTGTEEKILRRQCQSAIWVSMKQTVNQRRIHSRIHRIQADNQIRDCQFPVILSPVSYKRTVGDHKMAKPFIELSLVMRQFPGSNLRQIKYCKLLVQEFAVRIDMCFINSMLSYKTLSSQKTDCEQLLFLDLKQARTCLKEIAAAHSVQGQKDYIDDLHLSPMKIHLSFSLYAGGSVPPPPEGTFSGTKTLLQSVGVTITEFQGAILKLDYFERKNDYLTMVQLTSDILSHYTKQTLKQIYVVIFGLDLIGNPVGLILGIKAGVNDLFYEPLQGAIQGPEEFVTGLAKGVYSLFGHTIGGTAEAMEKITGALGKGVAALTLDEDYQKKRRMEKNKRPQDITEGIAQSGKDLVMGFYDGVTGVVTKPLEGAREDGATGFVKGLGKGLIGIVARPASGVVDFTSGTLASVKRATELQDVALPVRPPRFIRSDGIVQAFNKMEAEGHQLLQEVENGKYATSDAYVTHLSVCSDGRNFVILTSQRLLFIEKGDIFGHWNCEWEYTWDQIKTPSVCTEGVKVLLKEPKKKSLFQRGENGKVINISDPQIAQWLCSQMIKVMSQD